MCLAIPMKIKSIDGEFAQVEASGLKRKINIQMLQETEIGDYVLVHAGFAIEKIDSDKAKKTLELINEIR